jgi:hypothetical protein
MSDRVDVRQAGSARMLAFAVSHRRRAGGHPARPPIDLDMGGPPGTHSVARNDLEFG